MTTLKGQNVTNDWTIPRDEKHEPGVLTKEGLEELRLLDLYPNAANLLATVDALLERPVVTAAGPGEIVVTVPGFGSAVFEASGDIAREIVAHIRGPIKMPIELP